MTRWSAAIVLLALLADVATAQPGRAPARVPATEDKDVQLFGGTLRTLIAQAYQLPPPQIFGPAWLDGGHMDVTVRLLPGTTRDQEPRLLQEWLAKQFKLAAHQEMRVMNEFLLQIAPGGPKLDPTPEWKSRLATGMCEPRPTFQDCEGVPMQELARLLQREWPGVSPVYDRTGLPGLYDFALESAGKFNLGVRGNSPIAFKVQSLQDQLKSLGLTIQQTTGPVPVLIVDHCEKKPLKQEP